MRAPIPLVVYVVDVATSRPGLDERVQLMLDNGEAVIVSRQYAPAIKRKLGL